MNAAQRRAIEQARRKSTMHFLPQDGSTVYAALTLCRQLSMQEAQWPEFAELERTFGPDQEDEVRFEFSSRQLHIVVNSTCMLYGLTSTGKAQLHAQDGASITDDFSYQAADLLRRLHAYMGQAPEQLPDRLKDCQNRAEDLYAHLLEETGRVSPERGTA